MASLETFLREAFRISWSIQRTDENTAPSQIDVQNFSIQNFRSIPKNPLMYPAIADDICCHSSRATLLLPLESGDSFSQLLLPPPCIIIIRISSVCSDPAMGNGTIFNSVRSLPFLYISIPILSIPFLIPSTFHIFFPFSNISPFSSI